ncbi:MAG: dihydrolipoyl dehydrogenase [Firmicutes bacterium]|nr:dihydrolipoyl dehydrogenase [Bacillota bacterium]
MSERYDVVVIGAGPGGYVAAIKAAKLGKSVAIIEKTRAGGTCLNRGCIPTKAMLHAAEVYRSAVEGEQFGVSVSGASFDYGKICEYRESTIDQLVGGVEQLLAGNGVKVYEGLGRLLPGKKVEIITAMGTELIEAENVIIATGSVPVLPPIPGADLEGVVTSDGLFGMKEMPESLIIIGGGVIGTEFAQALSALGCRITIIEALARPLANMDKEISQNLRMILKKRGVDIHVSSTVESIEKTEKGLLCRFSEKGKEQTAEAAFVLCAAGRRANTEGLIGEGLELEMDRGRIVVNDRLETSLPGVYAIGDVIPGIQLAHVAEAEGMFVAEEIAGEDPELRLDIVPSCVYTSPEIGCAGMTDAEAKDAGINVVTGKFIMSANGKSLIAGEERGFIKVVAEAGSERILGAQMMCGRATDMIGEFVTAIANDLTVSNMLRGMRAHPTYNEGIGEALEDIVGGAIHAMPKRKK